MGRMADFTRWGYAIAEAAGIQRIVSEKRKCLNIECAT
jgi:hypothetical protein